MQGTRRAGGLPRTRSSFADEFFKTDPFRNFDYQQQDGSGPRGFSGNERYGPNSRMFGDDGGSFFDSFNHPSRYEEPGGGDFRSTGFSPNFRQQTSPTAATGSPPNQQRKWPPPFVHHRSKSHGPWSTNMDDSDHHHHQRFPSSYAEENEFQPSADVRHGNDPNVHIIKIQHEGEQPRHRGNSRAGKFVEINNSSPNYETLNPDKRGRYEKNFAESAQPTSIPNIIIDDYSAESSEEPSPASMPPQAPIPLPAPAIPLPPPDNMKNPIIHGEKVDRQENFIDNNGEKDGFEVENGRKTEIVHDNEKENEKENEVVAEEMTTNFVPVAESAETLIGLLDEMEHRVEQLRETANRMEQEKEAILGQIKNIKMTGQMLNSTGEKDELLLNTERILTRCNTVTVSVETPRDTNQTKALETVNKMITLVIDHLHEDVMGSKMRIRAFLNACHPDEVGQIDEKFQSAIIECTADDQKKIRRKLAQIIEQIG